MLPPSIRTCPPWEGIGLWGGGSRLLAVVSNTIILSHRCIAEGVAKGQTKSNQRAQSQGSHFNRGRLGVEVTDEKWGHGLASHAKFSSPTGRNALLRQGFLRCFTAMEDKSKGSVA